jgi:serine/threonine protein kinase
MQIKLDRTTWTRGSALPDGEGGFGKVYFAYNSETKDAVAKFVKKDPGATREMLIGESLGAATHNNVVPVLDFGEHDDCWVLVMPRAEMSLAQRLEQGDSLELGECVQILTDVAQALAGIENEIIHRDLKPANVLLLDGKWCLADFGIARYADAKTAADTRKFSVSEPYAAPEQWLLERAGSAADVYAFGVMAYELVAGHRPFLGPMQGDYRNQHLTVTPTPITGGTTRLRNIIMECLNKAPEARPRPANILLRLEKARLEPNLGGTRRLAKFDAEVLSRQAQAHAERRVMDDLATKRTRLFESSVAMFESISQPLYEEIADNATSATFLNPPNMIFSANLEGAKLGLSRPVPEPDWDGPFDVISTAVVSVNRDRHSIRGWIGRSHSLWFCDAHKAGEYGWYEMAFMSTRPGHVHEDLSPFSRKPGEAAQYFSGVYGVGQVAWPVTEIDGDDTSEFMDRWVGWFVDAAEKTLDAPTMMPERVAHGTWRTK